MAADNKKGGFWSWLGLGKKKETQDEAQTQSPETQLTETQSIESSQLETETVVEQVPSAESAVVSNEVSSSALAEHIVETETKSPSIEHQETETVEPVQSLASEVVVEEVSDEQVIPVPEQEETPAVELSQAENAPIVDEHAIGKTLVEESAVENEQELVAAPQEQEKPSEGGFFSRLVKGLLKTKQNIGVGFRSFFLGKKIDDELFEELEEQLLVADLGVPTTTKIINNLTQHASRKQLQDAELLYQQLKVEMAEILKPVAQPLLIDQSKKPYVILMVGVNGVGKTTTIGKLARKFQNEGKSVMLAAGDTFRAAAVEQLQVWGERNNIPVVAQSTGSDSASVIFDAMQSAAARNVDVLIADTAGRLQNKNNLMDELKKIVRVMKKYDETAPHEIMLTLDAGTGQNAISQAKLFHEAVGLTGISLTKLDGTAKGGVIFAIADQFNLPIRYIGVGEKIEDLREFKADEFIEALFVHDE
ncbi:signal recognition particle-docking protein FtsY [Pasteurella dagmatis]|uniref:Signal recognition particle receptor FtsY n=1 Tax=Pasteurella dagmatis ATCC 43325 TaxID=667128 RepID=C9PSQ3_9PAST|nr:signal recognition particle-docking protein FtsY [Pasteurella dagmatis]EEX49391.1 signal recognition particle-docking protein FtsY [Pasteurella dagmatis ATCC 43325]SNV81970.1 cell division protein FtsY [Pasteurella dagmatis]